MTWTHLLRILLVLHCNNCVTMRAISNIKFTFIYPHILISSLQTHTHTHTQYLQLTAQQLWDFTEIKLKNISSVQAENFILYNQYTWKLYSFFHINFTFPVFKYICLSNGCGYRLCHFWEPSILFLLISTQCPSRKSIHLKSFIIL
jgi:hypothetical protein